MRHNIRLAIIAMAVVPAFLVSAQEESKEKYAIRATAEKSLSNPLQIDYALEGMSTSSNSSDFGIDFGMTIWKKNKNSIEANIGVGYGFTTIKSNLSAMDFHYSAPAEADMDNEPYIRYGNLEGIYQKIKVDRITVPIYINYRYKFSRVFSLHALFGFRFGFNLNPRLKDAKANVFSYGVYPQYDDLMIDAPYMNEFGQADVGANTSLPKANKMTSAFIGGIGAEFRVYGPISIDLSARYEGSMSDLLKSTNSDIPFFEASNAPVAYTVAEGQRVISLPSYFTESKISCFSLAVSLLYRF